MKFSDRQKQMLRCLLEHPDYMVASQIADELQVSVKTIYRELQSLRNILEENNIDIDSKIGVGIRICVNAKQRNDLMLELHVENDADMHDRRYRILSELLQNSPSLTSYIKLSQDYYVGTSSIQNDLKFIEKWIQTYHLTLLKSVHGTGISGNERDIRKALTSIIIHHHDYGMEHMDIVMTNRMDGKTQAALMDQFGNDVVKFAETLVHIAEQDLKLQIPDPYYINIITHLLILMKRVRQGQLINQEHDAIQNVHVHIFRIAVEMAANIRLHMHVEIPDSEIYYIYQHLDSTGYRDEENLRSLDIENLKIDPEVQHYCDAMIEKMKKETGTDFSHDKHLKRYLLLHIHSMIGRITYGIDISCPLLSSVKQDCRTLFMALHKVVIELQCNKYENLVISEDEEAYLTLYFQASMEEHSIRHLRVIVVCSSGVGTSHLLMTRIQKTFPNWEILDQVAACQLKECTARYDDVDLIISTVKIDQNDIVIPFAYVSVLFNDSDIRNVESILENK